MLRTPRGCIVQRAGFLGTLHLAFFTKHPKFKFCLLLLSPGLQPMKNKRITPPPQAVYGSSAKILKFQRLASLRAEKLILPGSGGVGPAGV